MKYTGINIGPIIPTFSLVKKPRELWTASYMFSYLMKCIIDKLPADKIISPAKLSDKADKTIGLYPDRVFVEGEVEQELLDKAFETFAKELGFDDKKVKPYFNIMLVTKDFDISLKDTEGHIMLLNGLLDRMELCNKEVNGEAKELVFNYLRDNQNLLVKKVGKEFKERSVETIASYDIFEGDNDKSDKYICIVQADGDNMGSVVSSLPERLIVELSKKLLSFGETSCNTIREYGGLPIYAGGDDLLFLAPVLTSKGSIFDLIKSLDEHYKIVQEYVDDKLNDSVHTSMSYGISMTYHKYPLYEALDKARESLFDIAKNVDKKNAVAWNLQKHSGSSFKAQLSKNMTGLYNALINVINATENEQLVSAVSHKIRHNEVLLSLWLDVNDENMRKQRVKNFFDKIIDIEGKSDAAVKYMDAVQELLLEVYKNASVLSNETDKLEKMRKLTKIVYDMLRTAKFVKGKEDDK